MLKTDKYFLYPRYLFQASEHSIIGGCFVKFCVIINGITTLDVEKNSRMVQYINLRNFLKEDKKQKPVCVACLPSLCWRHSLA